MTTDEIKALLEGVTPGEWIWSAQSVDPEWAVIMTFGGHIIANVNDDHRQDANARFIAASRQIVPDLLAQIAALQARVAELEAGLGALVTLNGDRVGRTWNRARALIAKPTGDRT